jgi:hypothetical protein
MGKLGKLENMSIANDYLWENYGGGLWKWENWIEAIRKVPLFEY